MRENATWGPKAQAGTYVPELLRGALSYYHKFFLPSSGQLSPELGPTFSRARVNFLPSSGQRFYLKGVFPWFVNELIFIGLYELRVNCVFCVFLSVFGPSGPLPMSHALLHPHDISLKSAILCVAYLYRGAAKSNADFGDSLSCSAFLA